MDVDVTVREDGMADDELKGTVERIYALESGAEDEGDLEKTLEESDRIWEAYEAKRRPSAWLPLTDEEAEVLEDALRQVADSAVDDAVDDDSSVYGGVVGSLAGMVSKARERKPSWCIVVRWHEPEDGTLVHGPYHTREAAEAAWEGGDREPVWLKYASDAPDGVGCVLPDDIEHEFQELDL